MTDLERCETKPFAAKRDGVCDQCSAPMEPLALLLIPGSPVSRHNGYFVWACRPCHEAAAA